MKIKIFILTIFLVLTIGATGVFAQKAQRITFRPGAKQSVASGTLYSYKSRRYFVIRVRAGQTLNTEQIKSDASTRSITVSITAPNGETVGDSDASCNNRKEITPTVAGDYKIEVFECLKADAWRGSFRLRVRVE